MKPFVALTDIGLEGMTCQPVEVFVRIAHIQRIAFYKLIPGKSDSEPIRLPLAVVSLMNGRDVRVNDPEQLALLRNIALNQY